jgi:prepilin-type N-terminal cleavage/methylation domain-containing protein
MKKKGFSIIELVVAIAVSAIVVFMVTAFARDLFLLNSSAQSSMTAILESRKVLGTMVAELRSATPSALGSYTIESVATSSIIFFADVNSDKVADRIRYFFDSVSRSVRRGVVLASGSPPSYNIGSETFSTIITGVSNDASLPLFEYYDGEYDGSSPPLSFPVNVSDIRLVKINIRIERDPNRTPPQLMVVSSQAALRNLKDNL